MMTIRGWETTVSLAAAVTAGSILSPSFYSCASSEIVTLFSLIMAAAVPTMILSVSSMKSATMSVKEIRSLSTALYKQVSLFGGIFLYSLFASISVIFGKSTQWPSLKNFAVFSAIITFFLVFLILRCFSVIMGAQSLLRLAARLAEAEAIARASPHSDELDAYKTPDSYGSKIG